MVIATFQKGLSKMCQTKIINCIESQYVGYKREDRKNIYWLMKSGEFKVKKQ